MVRLRHLRVAALAELASLAMLLVNLVTVHFEAVSSLVGSAHGGAYLFVIAATWQRREATAAIRTASVVPGIGGLLAVRRLDRARLVDRHGEGAVR